MKIRDEIDTRLRHEAHRRGITISDLTCEAIEQHLGARGRRLCAAGAAHSGQDDISDQIEEILATEVPR